MADIIDPNLMLALGPAPKSKCGRPRKQSRTARQVVLRLNEQAQRDLEAVWRWLEKQTSAALNYTLTDAVTAALRLAAGGIHVYRKSQSIGGQQTGDGAAANFGRAIGATRTGGGAGAPVDRDPGDPGRPLPDQPGPDAPA